MEARKSFQCLKCTRVNVPFSFTSEATFSTFVYLHCLPLCLKGDIHQGKTENYEQSRKYLNADTLCKFGYQWNYSTNFYKSKLQVSISFSNKCCYFLRRSRARTLFDSGTITSYTVEPKNPLWFSYIDQLDQCRDMLVHILF